MPAKSVATSVSVCEPSLKPEAVSQVPETDEPVPVAITVAPAFSVHDERFESVAVPVTVTLPPTTAPAVGDVIAEAGTVLSTVTATALDAVEFPAASVATSVRLCEPSP